jgi:hypothetical protein
MAKIFNRPITSTTLAERKEAAARIGKKLRGRKKERWDAASEAQRLAFADKVLKKHGRRDKAGAIDWEGLMKFIQFLFDLLAPFLFPTT